MLQSLHGLFYKIKDFFIIEQFKGHSNFLNFFNSHGMELQHLQVCYKWMYFKQKFAIHSKVVPKMWVTQHNITQRHGPSKCNNEMLGAQSKFESPCATFQTFDCYILRTHKTWVECWWLLWTILDFKRLIKIWYVHFILGTLYI